MEVKGWEDIKNGFERSLKASLCPPGNRSWPSHKRKAWNSCGGSILLQQPLYGYGWKDGWNPQWNKLSGKSRSKKEIRELKNIIGNEGTNNCDTSDPVFLHPNPMQRTMDLQKTIHIMLQIKKNNWQNFKKKVANPFCHPSKSPCCTERIEHNRRNSHKEGVPTIKMEI